MAKITERKMMTKEKSHSMAGKKRSRRGRRVAAWFLAIAMLLTTISLPGNEKQASAMDVSELSEDEKLDIVMEGEVPVLKKITYSFKGDIAQSRGNWYLYVWEKGDTSGTDGTPAIVKEEALGISDELNKVELDLSGEESTVYVFGICFKDSRWSDDTSPEGWPSMSDACDYRIISDRSVADNLTVTVDGKKVSVSAEEVMADPTGYVCYHEWKVTETTEPDCVKDGFIEKTCNKCGTVRTLPGDTALGHNYVNGSCTRCRVEDPAPVKPSGEGTKESPYQITKVGELYWFAGLVNGDSAVCDYNADSNPEGVKQNLSACAELANDITINKGVLDEEGNPVAGQFSEWRPIGSKSNKYAGTFNGNEKAIRGLYFFDVEKEYVGLFGYIDATARIENVSVTDSYIYAKRFIAGVCARNEGGTIQNCHNSSRISGSGYNDILTAGGFCGFNIGTITECSNSGTIYGNAEESWLGGICFGNTTNGVIENCVNTGTIETGNFCEEGHIGGVAGYNYEKIKGCHNEGTVKGSNNAFAYEINVGGVCGKNTGGRSQIIRCYNMGNISANRKCYTGGICGYCEYYSEGAGIIQLCYNDSKVSGYAGGVCGYNDRARILNCYNLDFNTYGICREVSSNGGTIENCFSIGGNEIAAYSTPEEVTITNSYYLSDTETEDGGKTLTQFQNGEVACLLQEGQTADEETGEIPQVWGQNIDNIGDGTERQYYPVFSDAKVYETSAESDCKGYSNTKDNVREHYFGKDCTDEICDYCFEAKNINYLGLSADYSEITYDGKSHTPEITIKPKEAEDSDIDGSGDSGTDNSGDSSEDAGSLTEGTDYEVSVTPQTEVSADGYTATITGKGAYAGTRTVQWNIKPIELKLTVAGEATKPYDGTK
ncbi:MAG: hypothetical protein PUH02_05395, partial [bacterium]|nr:hypothetical protein [bacterium]